MKVKCDICKWTNTCKTKDNMLYCEKFIMKAKLLREKEKYRLSKGLTLVDKRKKEWYPLT